MEANVKTIAKPSLNADPPPRVEWEQCTVIRPRVDGDHPANVEISNGLLQKRVALSRRALMELVGGELYRPEAGVSRVRERLDAMGITRASTDERTSAGIEHWRKRCWTYALPYYVWSRRISVADSSTDAAEQRSRILNEYIAGSEPQPRYRTASAASRITLPPPAPLPDEPLANILLRRRASFTLPKRTMAQATLSSILWHALQSVRIARSADPAADPRLYLRSFGSALDFYVVAYSVDDLPAGVYFYDVGDHVLEPITSGDLRRPMQIALNGQQPPMTAACTLVMCAEFQRYQWRYRHERALRQLYVDTARIAHYAILIATAYYKYVHISPAVNDRGILSVLHRNPAEDQVLHTLSIA